MAKKSKKTEKRPVNTSSGARKPRLTPSYSTKLGEMYCGTAESLLRSQSAASYRKGIQLIFTSPPYPLAREKRYGNKQGLRYAQWLAKYAPLFSQHLAPRGSIVLEVGNAWVQGKPVMSTAVIEALLRFKEDGRFHLCQEFIWFNPARLPSPAQWVNVERTRVKDAFTRIWWMAKTPNPKANNRNVLKPYSKSMEDLLLREKYNAGKRPSEHQIGATSFLTNHGGAIPPNVIVATTDSKALTDNEISNFLVTANTRANDQYQSYCRDHKIATHPARMPESIAEFFIRFLTDEMDVVLDPFAGSNTTGAVAERLGRRWLSIEQNLEYVRGSQGRFSTQPEFSFTVSKIA